MDENLLELANNLGYSDLDEDAKCRVHDFINLVSLMLRSDFEVITVALPIAALKLNLQIMEAVTFSEEDAQNLSQNLDKAAGFIKDNIKLEVKDD